MPVDVRNPQFPKDPLFEALDLLRAALKLLEELPGEPASLVCVNAQKAADGSILSGRSRPTEALLGFPASGDEILKSHVRIL